MIQHLPFPCLDLGAEIIVQRVIVNQAIVKLLHEIVSRIPFSSHELMVKVAPLPPKTVHLCLTKLEYQPFCLLRPSHCTYVFGGLHFDPNLCC
mmetsp:Transcript_1238/g.3010  ORF Transcript_1238/g.3010 Transcript_1238/m.3010 type:complete len:93 (-) Transcript_1238:42-320(-)